MSVTTSMIGTGVLVSVVVSALFVLLVGHSRRGVSGPALRLTACLLLLALASTIVRLVLAVVTRVTTGPLSEPPRESMLAAIDEISVVAAASIPVLLLTVLIMEYARRSADARPSGKVTLGE